MRVLVCGGRDYTDYNRLEKELSQFTITTLITGVARGADMLGYNYGVLHHIPLAVYPADWKTYGKRAGYLRNTQMLVEGKPDLVVAFPGGAGTAMMCKIAKAAGVKVHYVQ